MGVMRENRTVGAAIEAYYSALSDEEARELEAWGEFAGNQLVCCQLSGALSRAGRQLGGLSPIPPPAGGDPQCDRRFGWIVEQFLKPDTVAGAQRDCLAAFCGFPGRR
jgi:hypothetical protein